MKQAILSAQEARRLLSYDKVVGRLIWLRRSADMFDDSLLRSKEHTCALWNSKHAGKEAGYLHYSSGYVVVRLKGFLYFAQRLAWLIETGEWPIAEIDHRNRDTADNSWGNLREASRRQNCQNQMKKKQGAVGLKGVVRRLNGRYVAQINIDGRVTGLGTFNCPAAAHLAYILASEKHHGEFGRIR